MAKKPKIVEDVNVEKKKKEHSVLKTFILVILIGFEYVAFLYS